MQSLCLLVNNTDRNNRASCLPPHQLLILLGAVYISIQQTEYCFAQTIFNTIMTGVYFMSYYTSYVCTVYLQLLSTLTNTSVTWHVMNKYFCLSYDRIKWYNETSYCIVYTKTSCQRQASVLCIQNIFPEKRKCIVYTKPHLVRDNLVYSVYEIPICQSSFLTKEAIKG